MSLLGLDLTMAIPGLTSSSSSSFSSSSSGSEAGGGGGGESKMVMMRELDINMPASREGEDEDGEEEEAEEEDGGARRVKKLRLSKEQTRLLEESFRHHHTLNPKQKGALAVKLKLRPRQVEVWFQNRRARTKVKQTEMECEYLKRCFGSLTEENRRLQREVEQLRALWVPPPVVLPPHTRLSLPTSSFTMCPQCEHISSATSASHHTTWRLRHSQSSVSAFRPTQPSATC